MTIVQATECPIADVTKPLLDDFFLVCGALVVYDEPTNRIALGNRTVLVSEPRSRDQRSHRGLYVGLPYRHTHPEEICMVFLQCSGGTQRTGTRLYHLYPVGGH